jgi:nucleoside-diphosphate-sugar epimerase
VIYGPGRKTVFTLEKIVGAALAGKAAQVQPMTDWPYIYIDDAAEAAVAACFAKGRTQLSYFIAHPEKVTLENIATAAAAAGKPVRLEIDVSKPIAARGPVDTEAPERDFGFRAKVGHSEGIRRMIEAAR